MKKLLTSILAVVMLTACSSPAPQEKPEEPKLAELPAPQDTTKTYKNGEEEATCELGVYDPACSSINSTNLKDYLGREDVLYIDLRDYTDYAITHLRNFEVIPFFGVIYNATANGEDLPQLYSGDTTAPVATYEESDDLLEAFFPQDQTIFLMCQSGGRVGKLMQILEAKGYDMSRIYNVGGMAQYATSDWLDYTTQTNELVVEATYKLDGLTLSK